MALINSNITSLSEVPITLLLGGKDRAEAFAAKYGGGMESRAYRGRG